MLTVQDIQAKQFHVRFRGFDPGEVDEFLEQVAAALQAANYENSRLKEQVAAAERKVTTYKQQEKSSLSAILSAQKIADEMKEKAGNEARELLAKAGQEARELTGKAQQEAQELTARARQEARELEESAGQEVARLERELDRLRAMKDQARKEVRQLLESYLAQIQQDDVAPTVTATTGATPAAAVAATAAAGAASAFIKPAEPAETVEPAPPTAADESDDLYQSIELSDDLLTLTEEKTEEKAESSPPAAPEAESAVELEDLTMPDLDGDMIFTLEDPLDQEETEEEDKPDSLLGLESVDLLLPGQGEKEGDEERLVIDDEELQLLDQDDLLGEEPDLNISLDDDEEPAKS